MYKCDPSLHENDIQINCIFLSCVFWFDLELAIFYLFLFIFFFFYCSRSFASHENVLHYYCTQDIKEIAWKRDATFLAFKILRQNRDEVLNERRRMTDRQTVRTDGQTGGKRRKTGRKEEEERGD